MAQYVEILDSIMGSNKTNGIIKWMDEHPDERYMYVSPLLSEVTGDSRLQTDLKYISFEYPESVEGGTKSDDLLNKLKSNVNICCTHSLYLLMDDSHLQEIKARGYVVIIDEELGVIDGLENYSRDDLDYLIAKKDITIGDTDGMISWVGGVVGKDAKYKHLSNLCNSKSVYAAKRQDNVMVTQLPIALFTCAKRVIIMTYMFEGNILDCFLKLKGIEIRPFTEVETTKISKEDIRALITLIPPTEVLRNIKMSYLGYERNSKSDCTKIESYIRNVCRAHHASSFDVMYTFPKKLTDTERSNGKKIRPASFTEYKIIKTDASGNPTLDKHGEHTIITEPCWLYASCRATNKYAFKWCLIHAYDRYPKAPVESYLQDYGHAPSRNVYAISDICQWVWRSRIRNGEPIVLAIASKRMYNLFNQWLEED